MTEQAVVGPSTTAAAASSVVVGTDIGGTFTDIYYFEPGTGRSGSYKVLTTHADPSDAVLVGLERLLEKLSADLEEIASVAHATTLATNALIERKGARTGMLTTRGFRDVIEVGFEQLYDLYDIHLELPAPLVPRSLRRPIDERTTFEGSVLMPVNPADATAALDFLLDRGVESIAICFLHAYANAANEKAMAGLIKARAPNLPVSLSSDILPEIGELGRFSTTVANAYVQPLVKRYLGRLVDRLGAAGHRGRFMVVTSRGGTMTTETAVAHPVRLLESGPAAGAHAASVFARRIGENNLMSFDMGGTSAKICLIRNGATQTTVEFEAARLERFKRKSGIPVRIPVVDLIEIGAGGGSIARINALGLPAVGPDSAGSEPGPVCYGQGGSEPTVTDADAVLGYLNPDYFLEGRLKLDVGAAAAALAEHLGRPLGVTELAAAWTVFRTVNDQMARAAAMHASEHGIDLRQFAILAFGGAGPVHAAYLARALSVRRVIVPPSPGVLSALGTVLAPPSFDLAASYKCELSKLDFPRVNKLFLEMAEQGNALLDAAGVRDERRVVRQVDMRYLNQRYEVQFELPHHQDLSLLDLEDLETAFRRAYRKRYGRVIEGVAVEAVTWRVEVSGPPLAFRSDQKVSGHKTEAVGKREVFFGEALIETPVFRRKELPRGARIKGPAIVEEAGSTTLVPPDARLSVDLHGNLVVDLASRSRRRS
jgi:N-methylhydantoinase A